MAILGAFAYSTSASLLREISIRQLDALAESKRRDLGKVGAGWRDQLRLIKSRTPLVTNLQTYIASGDENARQYVLSVIEDAATAVDDVDQIRIMNMAGEEIVRYGRVAPGYRTVIPEKSGVIVFNDSFSTNSGNVRVVFSSLLASGSTPIGVIEIVFDAIGVASVAENYTGLGQTGEIILSMREDNDRVRFLNTLRHPVPGAEQQTYALSEVSSAVQQSLDAEAEQGWLRTSDYRSVDVLAATRYLSGAGWGLVVKVDVAEEGQRAAALRDALIDIGLALGAFAIVGGTVLGFYLARPIQVLTRTVHRVREGETHLRADVSGDDEVAYLAESLNALLDHYHPGEPRSDTNDPPQV